MATKEQPTKEAVRAWLADRRDANTPPPSPQDIRRELGWQLDAGYDPLRRDCPR